MNEFCASGLPLGLLRNIRYEERAAQLFPGDTVLFYSDGLVEAHTERRELLGFPRMSSLMQQHDGGAGLIDGLLGALPVNTGPAWKQEDDITLMTLQRCRPAATGASNDLRAATPNAAYSEASDAAPAAIVLNFGAISYINSVGIALIVRLMAQAHAVGRVLLVYGLSEHYVEIFQITRLASYM